MHTVQVVPSCRFQCIGIGTGIGVGIEVAFGAILITKALLQQQHNCDASMSDLSFVACLEHVRLTAVDTGLSTLDMMICW